MNCLYCGNPTNNILELGRGIYTKKIPCCQECIIELDKLPQRRKDEIVKYAFITDVHKCSRCGKDHKKILVYDLLNPTDNHKYFTHCPTTGQPLFIEVV